MLLIIVCVMLVARLCWGVYGLLFRLECLLVVFGCLLISVASCLLLLPVFLGCYGCGGWMLIVLVFTVSFGIWFGCCLLAVGALLGVCFF